MADKLAGRILARDAAILGAMVVVGLVLRVLWVGASPLHPDEFHYAFNMMAAEETSSLSAIRDLDTRFLEERRSAHPLAWSLMTRWLWFLPLGWAVPWSPGFLRMPNVIMGTLLIPLAWGIIRLAADRRQAIAAMLFVALCPGLVWIARTLYQDTAFTAWIGLMLLGGAWGMQSPSRWPAVLVGGGMGLALATKVSAPMLLPAFVVMALAGGKDVPRRLRGVRLAIASGVMALLFLVFCDPMAYADAIRNPSDPRYEGAVSTGNAERLLVGDTDVLFNILLLDVPGTLLLCLLAAGLAWREKPAAFPLMLAATLACLSPLVLLHMPPLSGPHGFAPIYFVLMLLAAPMVSMHPRLAMIGILSANAGVAFTLVVAREVGGLDRVARAGVYPPRDAMYTALRHALHRRDPPRQVLIEGDQLFFHRAWGIIRIAELTEGAVVLTTPTPQPISATSWTLADAIVVPRYSADGTAHSAQFECTFVHMDFEVWRRREGEVRRQFTIDELEEAEEAEGEYLLPGGLRIVAGRIGVDGEILPRTLQEQAPLSMDGRVNFADWGSGRIVIQDSAADVTISLESPRMEDVFWEF